MNENKAIETLLNMYENIENELLVKIASHFSINDEFINSDYWKIKKLDEMGLFNEDIVDYIAKYSNKTTNEVKKALEKIGYNSLNFDNLNNLFKDGILKINPNILMKNDTITNIIKFAYNDLNNRFIEMSKKIEEATKDAYLNVVEQAYLKTSMGTHSYQEAIREAINELSNKGIRTLTYQTTNDQGNIVGLRSYNIEGMVRREVLTASRQLSNNISLEVANELNCEYLYLSEHVRCRPSHFDWQGTIIKKDDLVKVTDYGSVTGLGGPNCGHYAEPYFGDSRGDDLKSISKEDAEEQYKLSQKQRYLENGIKKWKRKREMFKASDDKEYYSKCKEKVKEWQNKAETFTQDNKLRRDYTREYIASKQTKEINITTNLKPQKYDVDKYKDDIIKNHKYYSQDKVLKSMSRFSSDSNLFIERQLNSKGFDKLPAKLSAIEFEKLSSDNYIKVRRGIKDYNGTSAEKLKDDFINGKLYVGRGNFGSGTYTAVDSAIAENYGGTVIDIAIPKNANIINYKDLVKIKKENFTKLDSLLYSSDFMEKYGNTFKIVLEKSLEDYSTYAIYMNYDMIQVDVEDYKRLLNITNVDNLHPYYIILNRGKVIVKE